MSINGHIAFRVRVAQQGVERGKGDTRNGWISEFVTEMSTRKKTKSAENLELLGLGIKGILELSQVLQLNNLT